MNTRFRIAACLLLLASLGGCEKPADPLPAPVQPATSGRPMPSGGGIEHIKVQATGRGKTIQAAVDQAIRLAIEQVNGKAIEASSSQIAAGASIAVGKFGLDMSGGAFAESLSSETRGAVTDFKLLSQSKSFFGGEFTAEIEASVAKFVRPESAKRLRVAVAQFRSKDGVFKIDGRITAAAEIGQRLRTGIVETLVQTNRVTVLDREFDSEVNEELERISGGNGAKDDFARLGQQLATDFLVVGRIDRFEYKRHERKLHLSGKTLMSRSGSAQVSYRLVNIATGQIELADSVEVTLPETQPTTLEVRVDAKEMTDGLASEISDLAGRKIALRLFPVTVVALDGDVATLSQGGMTLAVGQEYRVVLRGQEIKDPQSGQTLGRSEKSCCTVLVDRVAADFSYGKLANKTVDVEKVFAPGALEVAELIKGKDGKAPITQSLKSYRTSSAQSGRPEDNASDKDFDDAKPKADKKNSDW